MERLLTALEVAAALGVSRSLLYAKCARGEIPHVVLSGDRRRTIRFRAGDIEAWLREREVVISCSRKGPQGLRRGD